MEIWVIELWEIDKRKNLGKVWGLEYTPAEKFWKLRWYILDATWKVLESLVSIHSLLFKVKVWNTQYEIPVMVDTINLDDRDFNGSDRAILFYVKGFPTIQYRLDGKRHNNALYTDALEWFKAYLEDAIQKIQTGDQVDAKFLALSDFQKN